MSGSKNQVALEKELEQLVSINEAVGAIIKTIKKTQGNLKKIDESTENADKLLTQWIRILSQANFTKETLQNPHWNGNIDLEDDSLDAKLTREQELIEEAHQLDRDNSELEKALEEKKRKDALEAEKSRELMKKRHNELGLRNLPRKRGTSSLSRR